MVMAMTMAVCVLVSMHVMIVSAMLRIEGRFQWRQPRAKAAQHVLDHVVAPDPQPVADDLYVDVPVTDMPGEPRQFMHIRRRDLDERLRPADNPDDGAIVKDQAIAIVQRRGLRQIEQKARAALAAQNDAPAMALMGIERDRIDSAGGVPVAGGFDFVRTLHARNLDRL